MIYERILILSGGAFLSFLFFEYFFGLTVARIIIQAGTVAGIGFAGWYAFQNARLNLMERKAEIRRKNITVCDNQGNFIAVDHDRGQVRAFQTGRTPAGAIEAEAEPDTDTPPTLTALDIGRDADRAMVVGGTRSGKTFFCKNLAWLRGRAGDKVFALDPKDQTRLDPWPDGVRVVGAGDNFDEMARFWEWLDREKAHRGENMDRIRSYPFILIFFDEINDTLFERPDFKEPYLRVLRKYAQYRIGLFAIGQSNDVASIGLKGLGQLKQCFDCVLRFQHLKAENRRLAFCDYQNRAIPEFELAPYTPGTFPAPVPEPVSPEPEPGPVKRALLYLEAAKSRAEMFRSFLDSECLTGSNYRAQAGPLYKAYRDYCDRAGVQPWTATKFGREMGKRYKKEKDGYVYYLGLMLG